MINKIITHDGIFHADDAMAVALLLELVDSNIPVVRTRNIQQVDIDDPETWIVDVGGQYNPVLRLYDHHQDPNSVSACLLVFYALTMSPELQVELLDDLMSISEIDTKGPKQDSGFQFNSLIKSFNALENGWDIALETCRNYIRARKASADRAAESTHIWETGYKKTVYVKVCNDFPIHWKRYEDGICFLVYPNKDKWNVLSINSESYPLISDGKEEFLHANRFLAVYTDKEDAISCAVRSEINAFG